MFGFTVSSQTLVDGAMTGFVYGFYALGLILVYQACGVINFAYAAVGSMSATLLGMLVILYDWPYWPAVVVATAAAVALSAVIELAIVRRLSRAPRVVALIATVGVAQLVALIALSLPQSKGLLEKYPTPAEGRWSIAGVTVTATQLVAIVALTALGLGLGWFLKRSIWGLAVRGSASNQSASLLAGVNIRLVSTIVWCVAGGLAAVTTIFATPLRGVPVAQVATGANIEMLVRALAIALLARFSSLLVAVGAGVALGMVERVVFYNWPGANGATELIAFTIVLVGVYRAAADDPSRAGGWSLVSRTPPLPEHLRRHPLVRGVTFGFATLALSAAVLVPLLIDTNAQYFAFTNIVLAAIVVLSVVLLAGWAGQLSLAQFAFAGLGAMCMSVADQRMHLQFASAIAVAVCCCVLLAVVVGIPAFRLRGSQLAVVTMVFAIGAFTWLFHQDVFMTGGSSAHFAESSLQLGFLDLRDRRTYYLFCLGVLVVCMLAAYRIRRSGFGRSLVAVREDESVAAAYTISPRWTKVKAFAISGGMAGLAGALMMPAMGIARAEQFPVDKSLSAVAMAVIGGLGSVAGAVIGAMWAVGLPNVFGNNEKVMLATSGIGLLALILYFPPGLSHIGVMARNSLARYIGRNITEPPRRKLEQPPVHIRVPAAAKSSTQALQANDVTVDFGGRKVVDGVSLSVAGEETVGLIGANGAGKSTLMNAICGFVPASGTIVIDGVDVTNWSAARRAGAGLGRTFQNAQLFPDLTVTETIALAHERAVPTSLIPVLTGLPTWRRRNRRQLAMAQDLVDYLGLGRYADHHVGTLSTGTRRICELGCLLALEPEVICLDEPTAGVAQRETEALAPLIVGIRKDMGASMVVIEHDMPFIMAISDRVCCMDSGRMIAEGTPDEVRRDPGVIAAYLGVDERIIERSDSRVATRVQ